MWGFRVFGFRVSQSLGSRVQSSVQLLAFSSRRVGLGVGKTKVGIKD